MKLIKSASVMPLHAQITVADVGSDAVPDWVSGIEPAVSSNSMVLIATPPDTDGPISCRIWSGSTAPLWESIVFDGCLTLSSGSIEMGSIVGAELFSVTIGVGDHRVMIRAYPAEAVKVIDAFVFVDD